MENKLFTTLDDKDLYDSEGGSAISVSGRDIWFWWKVSEAIVDAGRGFVAGFKDEWNDND